MRFFVTGTPRSATGYASKLFKALKIPCTHEKLARPRGGLDEFVDWYSDNDRGESSWLAWPFFGCLPGPVPVLHAARDPWDVVDSLAHRNDIIPQRANIDHGKRILRKVLEALCPEVLEYKTDIERAAALVVHWNRRITEAVERYGFPYMRYQVESLNARTVGKMLDFIDVYRDGYEIEAALSDVPHNVNGGKFLSHNMEVTHPELVAAMVKALPDAPPIIGTISSTAGTKLSRADVEALLPRELRDGLSAYAKQCGYPLKNKEEITNEPSDKSEVCGHAQG